jgi:hypothetical protein
MQRELLVVVLDCARALRLGETQPRGRFRRLVSVIRLPVRELFLEAELAPERREIDRVATGLPQRSILDVFQERRDLHASSLGSCGLSWRLVREGGKRFVEPLRVVLTEEIANDLALHIIGKICVIADALVVSAFTKRRFDILDRIEPMTDEISEGSIDQLLPALTAFASHRFEHEIYVFEEQAPEHDLVAAIEPHECIVAVGLEILCTGEQPSHAGGIAHRVVRLAEYELPTARRSQLRHDPVSHRRS